MVSRVVDPGVNMFEGVILYGVSFRGEDKLNRSEEHTSELPVTQ